MREGYGLTTFHVHTNEWVRSCLFADGYFVCDRERGSLLLLAMYLLVPAYQHLWLVVLTTFISNSLVLTIPFTLAPDRFDVSSRHRPSRFDDQSN